VINMKKLILVVITLAAGALVFAKVRSRSDADLWHEATTR
jgi:hypothetical protein